MSKYTKNFDEFLNEDMPLNESTNNVRGHKFPLYGSYKPKNKKVSVIWQDSFMGNTHVLVLDSKDFIYYVKDYAQYEGLRAPFFVQGVPYKKDKKGNLRKQKKAVAQMSKGYEPYMVVIDDNGEAPDPSAKDVLVSKNDDVTVTTSKYMAFDDNYTKDADAILDEYIKKNKSKVIIDKRHTVGTAFIKDVEPAPKDSIAGGFFMIDKTYEDDFGSIIFKTPNYRVSQAITGYVSKDGDMKDMKELEGGVFPSQYKNTEKLGYGFIVRHGENSYEFIESKNPF